MVDERTLRSPGHAWWIVGLLVLLTLGAGAALRASQGVAATAGTDSEAATFSAASRQPVWFEGSLDRTAVLAGGDGRVRMELIMGADAPISMERVRRPTDLLVVLDRSGSMSGAKMQQARASIRELLAQLGPDDRFALVSYASGARVDIPLSSATGQAMRSWSAIVERVAPNGGTNMSAGLDLGLATIERARPSGRTARAILISDGLANEGDPTRHGLLLRGQRAARGEYVLSTIGVGLDFNEELLSALADAGTGNYYYVQTAGDLAYVFSAEFDAARATVASGLRVRIDPAPGVRVIEAAGYPLRAEGSAVSFRPGTLFAGQQRHVWVTLEVQGEPGATQALGEFELSFSAEGKRQALRFTQTPQVACVEDRKLFLSRMDRKRWERGVVEEEYGRLLGAVSQMVSAGQEAEAVHAIDDFVSRYDQLNQSLASPAVERQLREASELRDEAVSQAAEPESSSARKHWLKQNQLEALDKRRVGAKSSPTGGER